MPPEKTIPFFSIIVLFWKGHQYIQQSLDALNQQTFRDFEIILIDNASPEPLPDGLLENYPNLRIRFSRQDQNLGFAGGNNLGASLAKGKYLALLNSDAFPEPDWLENIQFAIDHYPGHFFASKQIMANSPDRLDGEGDVYHTSGLAWRRSYNRPVSESQSVEGEVFSPCAAAGIYPKEGFDLVGGFDSDYFSYVEDIDLGFRLRLAGYKCIYLPTAVVYHVGTGSTGLKSELSTYYGHRNLIWTFFKNMPAVLLVLLTPLHLALNLGLVILSVFQRRGAVMFRAKVDGFRTLGPVLRKRKEIQKNRKVSIFELLSAMDTNPFSPLALYFRRKD